MRIRESLLVPCAWGALFVSGLVGTVLPSAAQVPTETPGIQETPAKVSDLPDSPGATFAKAEAPMFPQASQPQAPPNQTPPNQTQINQSQTDQSQGSQPPSSPDTTSQAPPQRPVGTAAAEAPNTSGIAASEPAGVAIAPAKQRRARTIIIRTGAIIGAAVAVGVVVALTEATGSKPPGAH